MGMQVALGVKLPDIEQARAWVERATGLAAVARENDSYGNYYMFGDLLGERLVLFENGNDPYDGEPAYKFPEWPLLLLLERTNADSAALRRIEMVSRYFEKLKTDSWDVMDTTGNQVSNE